VYEFSHFKYVLKVLNYLFEEKTREILHYLSDHLRLFYDQERSYYSWY